MSKPFRFAWLDAFVEHGPHCPYQRSLGFSLNYRMDADGYCFMGVRRLALDSGMSKNSAQKYRKELEKNEWLEIKTKAKKVRGGQVDAYQARIPKSLSVSCGDTLINEKACHVVAHLKNESVSCESGKRVTTESKVGHPVVHNNRTIKENKEKSFSFHDENKIVRTGSIRKMKDILSGVSNEASTTSEVNAEAYRLAKQGE